MEHDIGNDHLALAYTHDGVERRPQPLYSNIVRLHHTGISFDINTQLSKLSWAIADRKIGFTEALRNFEAIVQTRPANPWMVWILASLANMAFCRLFEEIS